MFYVTLIGKIKKLSDEGYFKKDDVRITEYILNNPNHLSQLSITQLAKICETSPVRITRYCNKLGLSGFPELKLRLKDLENTINIDGHQVNIVKEIKDNKNTFFEQYYYINQESMEQQYQYFINKNLDYIVQKILSARKIYLFAFNLSYNISRNFCQRLRWLEIDIISEGDYISIETYLNIIKQEDLVFLITISGKNELIETIAKKLHKKVDIIGILDANCQFKEYFNDYLMLMTREKELWTINSIKAQLTIQLLDFIYAKVIEKIYS